MRIASDACALLVVDDPSALYRHKLQLEQDGYKVTDVSDAETARELASHSLPDIIFLQIGVRGSGSCRFLQAMRSNDNTRHIPVLMLSSYYNSGLRELGLTPIAERLW